MCATRFVRAALSLASKVQPFLSNLHPLQGVYNACMTFPSLNDLCEREDYRICCTTDTSLDLQSAYDQAAEDFYGTFSGENSNSSGEASTESEEIATDGCTGEDLLDGIIDKRSFIYDGIELGDDDMPSVAVQ